MSKKLRYNGRKYPKHKRKLNVLKRADAIRAKLPDFDFPFMGSIYRG